MVANAYEVMINLVRLMKKRVTQVCEGLCDFDVILNTTSTV